MSVQLDDIVVNLSKAKSWVRILFMIAFVAVLYIIIAPIILVMMIAQGLFSLITGENNYNLRMLGGSLNKYVFQILQFISYMSEDKPFPFSGFPDLADQGSRKRSSKAEEGVGKGLAVNTEKPAARKKETKKVVKKVSKKSVEKAAS
jgi:hypothetical protein